MSRTHRIAMILDNEFTGDLRVENEVQALRKAGHEVFVFCLSHGSTVLKEEYHGARIIRIPLSKFWKKKLNGLNNSILNIYPYWWKNKIVRLAREYKIEVLHVHDLWMLEGSILANKVLNLPIVADLHENYVHALAHYKWSTKWPGKWFVSIDKWKRSETSWLNQVDQVIVVIEEAKERLKKIISTNIPITVVPNYVNTSDFVVGDHNFVEKIKDKFAGNFTICYTGGFDIHRGIENVVRSLVEIKKTIKNVKLVLVGAGSNLQDLKDLAKQLKVSDYVSFEGWQRPEDLPAYIMAADTAIIPHVKTAHTDNTIPHKLFQYMFMEKPVLASNCDPLKRIIEETNAGLVFEQANVQDITDKVIEMWNIRPTYDQRGINGRVAVMKKYNWNTAAQALQKLYQKV